MTNKKVKKKNETKSIFPDQYIVIGDGDVLLNDVRIGDMVETLSYREAKDLVMDNIESLSEKIEVFKVERVKLNIEREVTYINVEFN